MDDGIWNPWSGIPDSDLDVAFHPVGPSLDDYSPGIKRARLYGVDAIHDEVQQHLRQVHAIAKRSEPERPARIALHDSPYSFSTSFRISTVRSSDRMPTCVLLRP